MGCDIIITNVSLSLSHLISCLFVIIVALRVYQSYCTVSVLHRCAAIAAAGSLPYLPLLLTSTVRGHPFAFAG